MSHEPSSQDTRESSQHGSGGRTCFGPNHRTLEALFLFGSSLSGTPLHVISLFFGSLATLFGAYLTAQKAPTDKLANVLVFWAINELLGILSLFVLSFPLWYNLVGTISVLLASLLGW